jgi:hypothetical protein
LFSNTILEATMHPTDEILRSYLDLQLPENERATISAHLAGCPECVDRLAVLAAKAARVQELLSVLSPTPAEAPRQANRALRQLYHKEKPTMSQLFTRRTLRPVWITLTVIAVLAVAFSFPQVQALASSFLDLFRVQQVTLLPIDNSALTGINQNTELGKAIGQLMSDSITTTRESTPPKDVASADEASKLAGFTVRTWKDAPLPAAYTVTSGTAFDFKVDRARAQGILDQLGQKDLVLPDSIDGTKVAVDIPAGVRTRYGDCPNKGDQDPDQQGNEKGTPPAPVALGDCLILMQQASPNIVSTPEIENVQSLAVIGLRALGMSKEDATSFAQKVDWSTTLVIPVPRGDASYEDAQLDGVSGYLLRPVGNKGPVDDGYTYIWVKDGMIYSIIGSGDPARGLDLANNLQ